MLTLVGLCPAGFRDDYRRGSTTDIKARCVRSHNLESISACQLKDLGEAEWATILDAHDEYMRRGSFERIYPDADRLELEELFPTARYANSILSKWLREGGEKCFQAGNQHMRPKWLPSCIFRDAL